MKKSGLPHPGEIVICRITSINPNSVFAQMNEYENEGMIHVSEVANRWVRDIREFVRENQLVVCRVMKVEDGHVSLSLKRVSREESASRLNEFKREKKSEKLLELVAKSMNTTLEKAYAEVGSDLMENFGSLTKAFDVAIKNPEMLVKFGLKKAWAQAITDVAQKAKGEKTYEIKVMMELVSYKPDGVTAIKALLSKLPKGFDAKYISAPKYMLSLRGSDRKAMEAEVIKTADALVKTIQKNDGSGKFALVSE